MTSLIESTEKIANAIKKICNEDGLLFEHLKIKHDVDNISISTRISKIQEGRSRFELNYLEVANQIDLNPIWLDKVALKNNEYLKIKGFHKNRYKKPIEILNLSRNEILFLHPDEVRYIWTRFRI
jgi:hypothetical protein